LVEGEAEGVAEADGGVGVGDLDFFLGDVGSGGVGDAV